MLRRIIAAIVTIFVTMAFFMGKANAMPKSWSTSRTTTVRGVTYRYRNSDRVAVVVRTRGTSVTIPRVVKIGSHKYSVRAIWEGGINKRCRTLTIRANLETCEDARLWKLRRVNVTTRSMYRWLRRTGANVRFVR